MWMFCFIVLRSVHEMSDVGHGVPFVSVLCGSIGFEFIIISGWNDTVFVAVFIVFGVQCGRRLHIAVPMVSHW